MAGGSEGGWAAASGDTWYSESIEAAGGQLVVPAVEAACESYGAPYLSTAQLLEVGADADVFISPGPWEDQDVSSLKAWQAGRVFDNQGPRGANARRRGAAGRSDGFVELARGFSLR